MGRQFLIFSFCLTAKERLFRIGTVLLFVFATECFCCLSNKYIRVGDEDNSFCGDIVYSFDLLNGLVVFRFVATIALWLKESGVCCVPIRLIDKG